MLLIRYSVHASAAFALAAVFTAFFWPQAAHAERLVESPKVEIYGAVRAPGLYALDGFYAPMADLLERAGGPRPDAYPLGAVLLREVEATTETILEPRPVCRLPWEAYQAVLAMRGALDEERLQSLVLDLIGGRRVRVPLHLGLADATSAALPLWSGDVLVIPPRPSYVHGIAGEQVREMLYEPGRTADQYSQDAELTTSWRRGRDLLVLPDGIVRVLKTRYWNYQPTAVPPGSLMVWGAAVLQRTCPPLTQAR
jgi:hypothetical protein